MTTDLRRGQGLCDTHTTVAAAQPLAADHLRHDTNRDGVASEPRPPAASIDVPTPFLHAPWPEDALLIYYADSLDDWEQTRIRQENRARALCDAKGLAGTPEGDEAWGAAKAIKAIEATVIRKLEAAVAAHPLGQLVAETPYLGAKSVGRLIGATGDPYWHPVYERPRTRGEWIAYLGLNPVDGVARRRTSGEKAKWNHRARKALWNIADRIWWNNAHYRDIYDEAKAKYADTKHDHPCRNSVRIKGTGNGCGTRAHPEWGEPGSSLRPSHVHARAIRAVMRAVAFDLYDEAVRLHGSAS